MKKIILALALLLMVMGSADARMSGVMLSGAGTAGEAPAGCTDANPVGNCTGFLICQNFETTAESCDPCTEDNSESWDKTIGGSGTITVDYATALRGSQSLQIVSDGSASSILATTFTAQDTIYGFFRLKVVDGRTSSTAEIMSLYGGSTQVGKVSINDAGAVLIYNGSEYATSTTTLSDGPSDTVYVWFYWTKGTGADGTMGIEVSSTQTFGAWEDEHTNGTAVVQVNSVRPRDRYVKGVVFDQILIKTTAVGTVCE